MQVKSFFSNFINTQGFISSFEKGQFYVQNYLKLNLVDIEHVGVSNSQDEPDRVDKIKINPEKTLSEGETKFKNLMGEEFSTRRKTKIIGKNTVYGAKQKFSINFSENSIAGLNPLYVNDVGIPNATAIEKRLREIAPSTELKEQRIHKFFNSTVMHDFYDNATSLLVVLLQFYWKKKIMERLTTVRHKFIFKANDVHIIANMEVEQAAVVICNLLNNHRSGFTAVPTDHDILNLAELLISWVAMLPERTIVNELKTTVPNPAYLEQSYPVEFDVFEMYEYDDGHSTSGRTFGNVFNFNNNKFKVPIGWDNLSNANNERLQPDANTFPDSDAAFKIWERADGFINCSGLSAVHAGILNLALHGNKRVSPLLIDQDLQIVKDNFKVIGLYCPDFTDLNCTFNSMDVARTISILVSTHRWHEDLLNATNSLRYWLAQPATETVESHWWHTIKRELSLPRVGLRRAMMGMLLEGDGTMITTDAVHNLTKALSMNDELLFESAFMNAAWYWGEYLMFYNSINLEHTKRKLFMMANDQLTSFERADAIVSAITGMAVPKSIYRQQATFITGGIEGNIKNRVKFGQVNIDHMDDYGYTVAEDGLTTNSLVCPSGVALIIGLSGPLIAGSPYSSIFGVRRAINKKVGFTRLKAMHYNDLWGMGVVSRWLGYDLFYKHPRARNAHRIYAANDVSVAMPPVNPNTDDSCTAYEFMSMRRRDHCFGSDLSLALGCNMVFSWQRDVATPLSYAAFNAPVCYVDDRSFAGIKFYKGVKANATKYTAYLLADYDYVTSDFQISYPELAVPLPVDIKMLPLQENDIGPATIEPNITINDQLPNNT